MSRIRPPLTTSMTVAGDDAVLFLDLLDRAPGALVLRALLGQDQAALLVLLLEDQGLDLVADLDDLVGVDVVLDRQLAGGDDALGLVADVEQDLVAVDLDDGAFDDVAVVEVLDGLVDGGEEVFGAADVVDGDLWGRGRADQCGVSGGGAGGAGGCLGAGRHVGRGLRCGRLVGVQRGGPLEVHRSTCRDPFECDRGRDCRVCGSSASLLGPRTRRPTAQRSAYAGAA